MPHRQFHSRLLLFSIRGGSLLNGRTLDPNVERFSAFTILAERISLNIFLFFLCTNVATVRGSLALLEYVKALTFLDNLAVSSAETEICGSQIEHSRKLFSNSKRICLGNIKTWNAANPEILHTVQ